MPRILNSPARALLAALLLGLPGGCDRGDGGPSTATTKNSKPRVAYVTNGVDPFWTIAAKGANDGAAEFNAEVTNVFPSNAEDQKQKIEDMLIRGVDGIAISPIDARNQT